MCPSPNRERAAAAALQAALTVVLRPRVRRAPSRRSLVASTWLRSTMLLEKRWSIRPLRYNPILMPRTCVGEGTDHLRQTLDTAELGPNRTEAATTLLGHMKKTGE